MIGSWNLFLGQILTRVCATDCRIQISVSISGSANTELPAHGIFPLHVLFARATSNDSFDGVSTYFSSWKIVVCVYQMVSFLICSFILQHSPVYRFSRACLLTSFSESGDSGRTKATFTMPDLRSLATFEVCSLSIILISCGKSVHPMWLFVDNTSFLSSIWFHFSLHFKRQIGRASCRERVCQYV